MYIWLSNKVVQGLAHNTLPVWVDAVFDLLKYFNYNYYRLCINHVNKRGIFELSPRSPFVDTFTK